MTDLQGNDKLELFRQEILKKAQAERTQILEEAERLKHDQLEQEESRLLEKLYRQIQGEISHIDTESRKTVSRETLALKKQLYTQREQFLSALVAEVRARLQAFAQGPDYEGYLLQKLQLMAADYRYEGSVIRVRTADLPLAGKIREIYGDCELVADDSAVSIGGAILENRAHGVRLDLSLETALMQERERFYQQETLLIGGDGGMQHEPS